MKKMLISLAVVSGLLVGSDAWARVVVHAGASVYHTPKNFRSTAEFLRRMGQDTA